MWTELFNAVTTATSAEALRDAARYAIREAGQLELDQADPPDDQPPYYNGDAVRFVDNMRESDPIKRLQQLWRAEVREPRGEWRNGASIITRLIMCEMGLGWNTCDIKTWQPGVQYTRNGQFAWCGATAAWAHGALVDSKTRKHHMSSLSRMYRRWYDSDALVADASRVQPGEFLRRIEPGDIGIVGYGFDRKRVGNHIVIIERPVYDTGVVLTYEGNAHGMMPDGTFDEGVIQRSRGFKIGDTCPVTAKRQNMRLMYVYRPSLGVRDDADA